MKGNDPLLPSRGAEMFAIPAVDEVNLAPTAPHELNALEVTAMEFRGEENALRECYPLELVALLELRAVEPTVAEVHILQEVNAPESALLEITPAVFVVRDKFPQTTCPFEHLALMQYFFQW